MRPAFSHIAWQPDEDPAAHEVLATLGIRDLEIAPGRLWQNPASVAESEIAQSLASLRTHSLAVCGFQAILFGKPELTLFGGDDARQALQDYLRGLIRTCAASGGRYLVFGAPKNRQVPEGLSREAAREIARDFFRETGRNASAAGVTVGIEANPAEYGCNFCTHVAEVADLVRAVASPGVRWHLDTGEFAMNGELVPEVIRDNADLIGSVHVSEPQLAGFENPWIGHRATALALRDSGYRETISVEMKRAPDGLASVRRVAEFVLQTYF